MYIWFFICVLGVIAAIPLHFLSIEQLKLRKKYGKKRGEVIGAIYGRISAYMFFLFWIGIWVSPQPRFTIQILQNLSLRVPFINFSIPLFHLIISMLFLLTGVYLLFKSVKEVTTKVAETHIVEKVVTTGVYSIVRHPQYLGYLLAHVGISFILSALYSLIFTPLLVMVVYFLLRKEEEELIREFGKEYQDYKEKTPLLIPRLRK